MGMEYYTVKYFRRANMNPNTTESNGAPKVCELPFGSMTITGDCTFRQTGRNTWKPDQVYLHVHTKEFNCHVHCKVNCLPVDEICKHVHYLSAFKLMAGIKELQS